METKILGRTNLEVPIIGLGAMFIGSSETEAPTDLNEDLGAQTVLAALEAGCTLIDTAPLYGGTTSESFIGRVLKERPDLALECTVVTKVGSQRGHKDYSYDAVMQNVEDSQKRLGIETFAFLCIHDAMGHPMEEVMAKDGALGALRKLQDEGVVRFVGSAMNDPHTNAPYIETGEFDVAVIPNAWSLLNQLAAERIFPAAEKHNVGLLMATPFERGLLAKGPVPDAYFHRREFSQECLDHVSRIQALCLDYDISLATAALRWGARHPLVASVIPGARTPEEAMENIQAADVDIPERFWEDLEPLVKHWEAGVHR